MSAKSAINCRYHPETPARWWCGSCQINFCSSCQSQHGEGDRVRCPIYQEVATEVGRDGRVEPFWNRFPKFVQFPLSPQPLLLMLLLTLISHLLGDTSLVSLLGNLVLTAIFFKYAYGVLRDVALGTQVSVSWRALLSEGDFGLDIKQYVILIFMRAPLDFILKTFGLGMVIGYYLLVMLLLPISVIVLALEESVPAALNP